MQPLVSWPPRCPTARFAVRRFDHRSWAGRGGIYCRPRPDREAGGRNSCGNCLECQGKSNPQRLVLTGKAKGVIAYQAIAEADHQWTVVPNNADQNSPSSPLKPAPSAGGSTSDADSPEGGRSAQANLDEKTPLAGTTSDGSSDTAVETPQKYPANASATRQPIYEAINCAGARPGISRVICGDRNLVAMDKKLATAFTVLASGPNPPPELGSDQDKWIAMRDRCPTSPVYCLHDAYETRLAELALQASSDVSSSSLSPDDGVTAESTRTAKRWGVPMLQGLPYLPRANEVKGQIGSETFVRLAIPQAIRSGLGAQHIGNFAFLVSRHQSGGAGRSAWTRMMYAAGLATSPDVMASLDDNFFASLACVFLEHDVVKASPGGELCDYMPSRSQAEEAFAIHDLAESFRKNDLPRIIETSPHLPFRFLVVIPASIRDYDLEKKQFAVWAGNGNEFKVSVLGSHVTELKELYWPMPETDARGFISTHKGQRSIQAYIAVPLTIMGAQQTSR